MCGPDGCVHGPTIASSRVGVPAGQACSPYDKGPRLAAAVMTWGGWSAQTLLRFPLFPRHSCFLGSPVGLQLIGSLGMPVSAQAGVHLADTDTDSGPTEEHRAPVPGDRAWGLRGAGGLSLVAGGQVWSWLLGPTHTPDTAGFHCASLAHLAVGVTNSPEDSPHLAQGV